MTAMMQAPAAQQPRLIRTVNLDRQMCRLRFSPCGRYLAGGGFDAKVRRWEYTEAGLTDMPHLEGHHGWVQTLAFHPDRQRLFTADSWGEVRCWPFTERTPRPTLTFTAHDGWVRDLAISGDGCFIATCGADRKVCLWSADNGRKVREMSNPHDVFSVAFHPDNRKLVSGDLRGIVTEWEVDSGRRGREFDCRTMYALNRLADVGGARRLVFDAEGRTLACAGARQGASGGGPAILLFDWETARLRHTIAVGVPTDGFVFDLAFQADYVMAITSGTPGSGKFFLHRPGADTPFFISTTMPNCHSLALHPTARRLYIAATNGGSNGNGRALREGEYRGNFSPLHLWELPERM